MYHAHIGKTFVFSIVFVDGFNNKVAVENPTITIYHYGVDGSKSILIDEDEMNPAAPVEVGRYVYPFLVPNIFDDGDMLYADITADGGYYIEVAVQVKSPVQLTTTGLIARFLQ